MPCLAGLSTTGTPPLLGCAEEEIEKHLVHSLLMPVDEAEGWVNLRFILQ